MSLHNEIELENEIWEHRSPNGWQNKDREAPDFDGNLVLLSATVTGENQHGQSSGAII